MTVSTALNRTRLSLALPLLHALLVILGACVAPAAPAAEAPAAETAAEAAPAEAAAPAPITEYVNPDLLVDTAWVKENLENPNVRFLALHGKPEDFAAGHLPGAIFVNTNDLANPNDPIAGEILTSEQLAEVASRRGIENDDTLVLYDSSNNLWAARGYW
ncbi:MAG: rhodanese-like domain-containing protein, partial [Caldilineaceae bacterium]